MELLITRRILTTTGDATTLCASGQVELCYEILAQRPNLGEDAPKLLSQLECDATNLPHLTGIRVVCTFKDALAFVHQRPVDGLGIAFRLLTLLHLLAVVTDACLQVRRVCESQRVIDFRAFVFGQCAIHFTFTPSHLHKPSVRKRVARAAEMVFFSHPQNDRRFSANWFEAKLICGDGS